MTFFLVSIARNSISKYAVVWNDKVSTVFSCNNCRWLLRFVVLGRRNLFSRSMGNGTVKWWPSGQILVELKCLLTLTKWTFPTNFAKKSTNNSVMSQEGKLLDICKCVWLSWPIFLPFRYGGGILELIFGMTWVDFKKWVKSIQTAGYNGGRTVY